MKVPTARVLSLAPNKALKTGRSATPGMAPQPPSSGPRSAEEIAEELRAAIARGAASARAQLGVSDSGRHGAEDAIRPGAEGETGRGAEGETSQGGKEDAA